MIENEVSAVDAASLPFRMFKLTLRKQGNSMSSEIGFSVKTKELGDVIAGLTLLEAVQLAEYLDVAHGIRPAAGAGVAAAPIAASGASADLPKEKTEFDVVLTSFGDNKIGVIKVVRTLTGLGLKEAKDLVEGVPKPLKTGISKDDSDKVKADIELAGGKVDVR